MIPISRLRMTITNNRYAVATAGFVAAIVVSGGMVDYQSGLSRRTLLLITGLALVWLLTAGALMDRLSRRSEKALLESGLRDSLTGLRNRAGLQQWFAENAEESRPTALIYIDLDHFNLINDVAGHSAGDQLLISTARLIEDSFDGVDVIGRIAGDDFVVITHCRPDAIESQAERLLDAIRSSPFTAGSTVFRVTASIGIFKIGTTHEGFDNLLAEVDVARMEAKDQGRDRLAILDATRTGIRDIRDIMHNASGLFDRFMNGELRLAYQRIEGLGGQADTCEVLLRTAASGDDPEDSPAALIEAAETFGMITTIDEWVITATLLAIEGGHLNDFARIGVNLSLRSIINQAFVDSLERILRAHPEAAHRLCLELTETAVVTAPERIREAMLRIKRRGVIFAIDDFGSGASSFGLLRNLPFDTLKIDGQFVRRMNDDASDREVIKACVPIAQLRNMTTVAEWVEDKASLSILRDLSVDYVQGFAVARPVLLDLPLVWKEATRSMIESIDIRDAEREQERISIEEVTGPAEVLRPRGYRLALS